MPIQVICRSCHARFAVSEKFAGKKGPCPKCKAEITVPETKDEVVIHAPEDFDSGGKTATGQLALKPIQRKEVKLSAVAVAGTLGAIVAVFLVAWMFHPGSDDDPPPPPPMLVLALGAIALAPPLVWGGYSFLRDDELEPYRHVSLWIRVAICSVVYALLWGFFLAVKTYLLQGSGDEQLGLLPLAFVILAFLALGALAAHTSLDLDPTTAVFHYGLYIVVTVLLRLTMGMYAL